MNCQQHTKQHLDDSGKPACNLTTHLRQPSDTYKAFELVFHFIAELLIDWWLHVADDFLQCICVSDPEPWEPPVLQVPRTLEPPAVVLKP